jgi:hypothetical protein
MAVRKLFTAALCALAAALGPAAAGPAAAGDAETVFTDLYVAQHADEEVNLCGFYREGGRVLQIKQLGGRVRGYLVEGTMRCLEEGSLYFQGAISGIKFTGEMTVCNPEICVEAGLMPATRTTEFEFLAFGGGKRLWGSWVHDRIEYREEDGRVVSCQDESQVRKHDFSARRQEDDCASLKLALSQRRQTLAWYQGYSVTSTGAVVGPDAREVAGGFNGVQQALAEEVAGPRAGGSGVQGSISYWRFEDVVRGERAGHDSLCWCETSCQQDAGMDCLEDWAHRECQAHEAAHCQSMISLCRRQIAGVAHDQALANWQAYTADAGAQLAEEVAAYQVSIATLEQMLEEAGCP